MNLKVSLLNTKYTYSIILFIENPIHSDKDQISGLLGKRWGGHEGGLTKGTEASEVMDTVTIMNCDDGSMGVYIYVKFFKMNTLSIYSLLVPVAS